MSMITIKKCANAFKALSNPHRLELFLKIFEQHKLSLDEGKKCECLISEIISHFKIGAPTISHHIKELAQADLIKTEKNGKHLVCEVNMETLQEVLDQFKIERRKK